MTDTKPRYEWVSNGGCERCDALDGHLCEYAPARPHRHCDCRIVDRSRPSTSCDSSDLRYDVHPTGSYHSVNNPGPDDEFDLTFDYTITCWGNAQELTGEVLVAVRYGDLDDVEDAFDDCLAEALEKVEEIAVYECPVCAEHPHRV